MNSVLKHALEDYKRAMHKLNNDLGEERPRKRPMVTLGPNCHARFVGLRNKRPGDFREFMELARLYETDRLERSAEAVRLEQEKEKEKAEADLLGVNPEELEKISTDLNRAFRRRTRIRDSRPDLLQGKFASAYIHALRRGDRKISPALPADTIEAVAKG